MFLCLVDPLLSCSDSDFAADPIEDDRKGNTESFQHRFTF
jgi:hypothetical protein